MSESQHLPLVTHAAPYADNDDDGASSIEMADMPSAPPRDETTRNLPPSTSTLPETPPPRFTFNSNDQTRTLFRKLVWQFLLTCLFLSCIIITAKLYEAKGTITPDEKSSFNVITTALGILLAINFLVCQTFLSIVCGKEGLIHCWPYSKRSYI